MPGIFTNAYRERERGIFGVRKQYRTQGLNALVKALEIVQDERTEDEITDESGGLVPILVIPSGTWYRHIARVTGRRLDLVKVAEAHGVGGVRLLIESWGLRWGIDVFDPPTEDEPTTQAGEDEPEPKVSTLLELPGRPNLHGARPPCPPPTAGRRKLTSVSTNSLSVVTDPSPRPRPCPVAPENQSGCRAGRALLGPVTYNLLTVVTVPADRPRSPDNRSGGSAY